MSTHTHTKKISLWQWYYRSPQAHACTCVYIAVCTGGLPCTQAGMPAMLDDATGFTLHAAYSSGPDSKTRPIYLHKLGYKNPMMRSILEARICSALRPDCGEKNSLVQSTMTPTPQYHSCKVCVNSHSDSRQWACIYTVLFHKSVSSQKDNSMTDQLCPEDLAVIRLKTSF